MTERYTSHDIQNEIINLMSNKIMRNLLESVRSCIFSIMCDEHKDISNKEQLTFCMRWVTNNLEVCQKLLEFYEMLDIKSSTIVKVINEILLRYQLNLDMCRGQCYGGASNRLGKSSFAATQIFAEQPKVHFANCHAHSLTLSVKDATKNTKNLRDTVGTAEKITILIK